MAFFSPSPMETLAAKQSYRPLLPEERERLIMQKQCQRAKLGIASLTDDCTLYLQTDYQAYYEDWHIQQEIKRTNTLE